MTTVDDAVKEVFEEDKRAMAEDWERLIAELTTAGIKLPSGFEEILHKTFDAGWSGGSMQTLRHFTQPLDDRVDGEIRPTFVNDKFTGYKFYPK